jgi:hypothetical protein
MVAVVVVLVVLTRPNSGSWQQQHALRKARLWARRARCILYHQSKRFESNNVAFLRTPPLFKLGNTSLILLNTDMI